MAFIRGFNPPTRHTLQTFLTTAEPAVHGALRDFLWHLIAFAESEEAAPFGVSKQSSFGLVTSSSAMLAVGTTVLTVTMKGGDDVWQAYDRFYDTHADWLRRPIVRLSRGCSFLIGPGKTYYTGILRSVNTLHREKFKLANYVGMTMLLRPLLQAPNKMPLDVDDAFGKALTQLRRWRVYEQAGRYEVLKMIYLVVAYATAFYQ